MIKTKSYCTQGKACNGTTHDKKTADEENPEFPPTSNIELFQDSGYQGYCPDNITIIQPQKKPKGKELTRQQKEINRTISSKRVIIEHVIGGVKILRIIKDEIRIYKEKTRNLIMKIACAIYNLKIIKS